MYDYGYSQNNHIEHRKRPSKDRDHHCNYKIYFVIILITNFISISFSFKTNTVK